MRLRAITFKIDEKLLKRLDDAAALLGISRSEAIREAILLYLRHLERSFAPRPKVVILTS